MILLFNPFHSDGYPIHNDTINMEKSILYFKVLLVKISIKWCISVPEECFNFSKQCRLKCCLKRY